MGVSVDPKQSNCPCHVNLFAANPETLARTVRAMAPFSGPGALGTTLTRPPLGKSLDQEASGQVKNTPTVTASPLMPGQGAQGIFAADTSLAASNASTAQITRRALIASSNDAGPFVEGARSSPFGAA